MKISEISSLTGIPVTTLRDWEKYLDLKIPRDENGDRVYSQGWVEYL